jgi:hypothetical protein
VSLVVDMKPVVDGVVLQVGHVAGDVYCSHNQTSLGPNRGLLAPGRPGWERR